MMQICVIGVPCLVLFALMLFQGFSDLFLKFLSMQAAGQDDAFAVNQHGVGNAAYGIQFGAFAIPVFQVGHLRPSDVSFSMPFFQASASRSKDTPTISKPLLRYFL